MTKKALNNTMLDVLSACADKYQPPVLPLGYNDIGLMVDFTTYMVDKLKCIINTPVVKGDMTFDEAVSILRPFLWIKFLSMGFTGNNEMWKMLAIHADEKLVQAWHDLKVVCKR